MVENQNSHATAYNRYPEIFEGVKEIISTPSCILSFGCSTGEECETLQELYYPNVNIIGFDISEKVIKKNIEKNKYKNIQYYSKVDNIPKRSDIIFANSVLCRWPDPKLSTIPNFPQYTFEMFESTLEYVDNLLNKDGYLCIYNSTYLFSETNLFRNKKYEKIETPHKETGFVTKYHKNGKKINFNYPYYLFKKTEF